MTGDLVFFRSANRLSLAAVAAQGGAELPADADSARLFVSVAALDQATTRDVSFLSDDRALEDLGSTRAGACFVTPRHRDQVPVGTIALVTDDPSRAFERVASLLYPESVKPGSVFGRTGIDPAAIVHGDARLEPGVTIDPGAVIGPGAEIGSGTTIGANTTVGACVRIGRDCAIDANASISNALIGDRVIVHSGARIGHGAPNVDARAGSPASHLGRVIVQNDVEVGANAAIERGPMEDTVIGEGSRIGTLVVVKRGATIQRHATVDRL